jgi:hypothetical protein
MKANTGIAVKQGLMNIPEQIEITERAIKNYLTMRS